MQQQTLPPKAQFDAIAAEWLDRVEVIDVLDELAGAEASLAVAINKGDAALIGRIVLAVRKAYAERLANRSDYGGRLGVLGAAEAAALVLAS